MQTPGHPHHNHVFDPALTHHQQPQPMAGIEDGQVNSSSEGPSVSLGLNPDGTPIKRRPGRPKGSTKKNLLAGSPLPPKIKRPVGRPRKDGFPAGSVGSRVKRERTAGAQAAVPVVSRELRYPDGGLKGSRFTSEEWATPKYSSGTLSMVQWPRCQLRHPCSTSTQRWTGALWGIMNGLNSLGRTPMASLVLCWRLLLLPILCRAPDPPLKKHSNHILFP